MIVSRSLVVSLVMLLPLGAMSQTRVRTPVLVELFTSEGCSSCPPADVLLAKLSREQPVPSANIIILEEHVDYWDSLGWRDRFSSHSFTDRQTMYSLHFHIPDVYTPQMVVAGRRGFNGTDSGAAARAIVQAARMPGVTLALSNVHLEGRRLTAKLALPDGAGAAGNGDLYVAIVAPMAATKVGAGENSGRILLHAGVALSVKKIGSLRTHTEAIELEAPAGQQSLSLVVFAQEPDGGPVLGVASAVVPAASSPAVASLTN